MTRNGCTQRYAALAFTVLFAAAVQLPTPARAYNPKTHQRITEAAWTLIKKYAREHGESDYPKGSDARRAVELFQGLQAPPCVADGSQGCDSASRRQSLPLSSYNEPLTPYGGAIAKRLPAEGLYRYLSSVSPDCPGGASGKCENGTFCSGGNCVSDLGACIDSSECGAGARCIDNRCYPADYTGTVLGYYVGHADHMLDAYIYSKITPISVAAYGLAVAAEPFIIAGEALLESWYCWLCGLLAVVGGWAAVIPCLIACNGSDGEWSSLVNKLPWVSRHDWDGKNLTAFQHYMNNKGVIGQPYTAKFDDLDGYSYHDAVATSMEEDVGSFLAGLFEVRLEFHSRDIYNILPPAWAVTPTSNDAQPPTSTAYGDRRDQSYWDASGNTIYGYPVIMPSDNAAFARWQDWLQLKAVGANREALLSLGIALHMVQDVTVAHHALSTQGGANHSEYENIMERHFDNTTACASATAGNCKVDAAAIIVNWNDRWLENTVHQHLVEDIGPWFTSLRQQYPFLGERNDVPVRELARRISAKVLDHHWRHKMMPWQGDTARDPRAVAAMARPAMGWAIAATVALLVEASRDDIRPLATQPQSLLGGPSGRFVGPLDDIDDDGMDNADDRCPLLAGSSSDGCRPPSDRFSADELAYYDCLALRLQPAVVSWNESRDHFGLLTTSAWMQAECQTDILGATNGDTSQRAQARIDQLQLLANFMQSGDRLALRKEVGCVRSSYPEVFPNATPATEQGWCNCTLDSDGDGVSECDDECKHTPAGTAVDGKGCALP